jgi:hypothetical protein
VSPHACVCWVSQPTHPCCAHASAGQVAVSAAAAWQGWLATCRCGGL